MNGREFVNAAIAHDTSHGTPFSIGLTGDCIDERAHRLIDRYGDGRIRAAVSEGVINCVEGAYMAAGNSTFCLGAPWWNWYDLPAEYQMPDTPAYIPKIAGNGSYEELSRKIDFARSYGCYVLVQCYGIHFERAYFARSLENFLYDMAANREYCKRILSFIIEQNLAMLRNFAYLPGIDGILLGSDWGSQKGMLMSPDTWRELIMDGERRMYDLVKSGGKHLFIHSCGKIEPIIPHLIEMGVDVLNPVQPECMDISMLKQNFGDHLTFFGGISTQHTLPYGTPDEVAAETRRVIDLLGRGGGLIASPSQEIQQDVPDENVFALLDTLREYSVPDRNPG